MICKLDRLVKGEFRRIPEIVGPVTAKTSVFTFVFPYKYSRNMRRVSMAAHLFFGGMYHETVSEQQNGKHKMGITPAVW